MNLRVRIVAGRLRSYLDPPGAVGGAYGSGCFHFSSKSSVSRNKAYGTNQSPYTLVVQRSPYSLLSWVLDVLVGLEQLTDI